MRRLGVLLACAFQLAVVRSQSICHYGTLTGRLLPPSGQWWQEPVLPQCKLSTEPISRLERFMASYYSGQDGTRRTVLDRLEANVDAVKRGDGKPRAVLSAPRVGRYISSSDLLLIDLELAAAAAAAALSSKLVLYSGLSPDLLLPSSAVHS